MAVARVSSYAAPSEPSSPLILPATRSAPLRILFVCPEVPWPLDQGGRIRTFRLFVRGLSELGHEVDALFVRHNGQEEHRTAFAPYLGEIRYLSRAAGGILTLGRAMRSLATGVPFANLKYTPPELGAAVSAMCAARPYDLVLAEHQHVADDVLSATRLPVVIDMQNVYSDLYKRVARSSLVSVKAWHSRFQISLALRQERRLDFAIGLLTTSPEDSASLLRSGTTRPCFVVPNGVDLEQFRPGQLPALPNVGPSKEEQSIVMTGSMDYFPNADGARFLVDEVMPSVWAQAPQTRVWIVGRDPGREVRRLGGDARVTVTGAVPDVRPYLESSSVTVVPLRSGSGTRLKALEAAAMGKAIVGTSVGLEGIPFAHGVSAMISDSAPDMASSLVALLKDRELAAKLGANARRLVEEGFSWEACCESLDAALATLLPIARSRAGAV